MIDPDWYFSPANGGQTYYVSNEGNDDNGDNNAIALRTLSDVRDNMGPRRRFLFKRGDAWQYDGYIAINNNGPGIIGAYGNGDNPKINVVNLSNGDDDVFTMYNSVEWTLFFWRDS